LGLFYWKDIGSATWLEKPSAKSRRSSVDVSGFSNGYGTAQGNAKLGICGQNMK
jgi:hypothetical protein